MGLKLQNDKLFLNWTDELRIMSSSCRKRIKTVLNDRYRVASAHLRPTAEPELQTQREQREARHQLADQRRKLSVSTRSTHVSTSKGAFL